MICIFGGAESGGSELWESGIKVQEKWRNGGLNAHSDTQWCLSKSIEVSVLSRALHYCKYVFFFVIKKWTFRERNLRNIPLYLSVW